MKTQSQKSAEAAAKLQNDHRVRFYASCRVFLAEGYCWRIEDDNAEFGYDYSSSRRFSSLIEAASKLDEILTDEEADMEMAEACSEYSRTPDDTPEYLLDRGIYGINR